MPSAMEPDDRARTQIGVWALRACVLSSSDLAGLGSELVAAAIARVLSRESECLLLVRYYLLLVPPAGQPSPETFCPQFVIRACSLGVHLHTHGHVPVEVPRPV